MQVENPVALNPVRLTCASVCGDGMHLELSASTEQHHLISGGPLLSFRAEEGGIIQVVLHLDEKDVTFPLEELKRAITAAEEEVHPESYYP